MVVPLRLCFFCQPCNGLQDKSLKPEKMFHAKFGMINGAGWFLEHADPLLKAGLDSEIPKKYGGPHSRVPLSSPPGLFCTQCHTVFMRVFCFLEIRFMLLSQKFFLSPAALMLPHPPPKKKNISCVELAQHSVFLGIHDYPISYLEFNFLAGSLIHQKSQVSIQPRSSGALGFAQYLPAEMSLFSKEWHEWHSSSWNCLSMIFGQFVEGYRYRRYSHWTFEIWFERCCTEWAFFTGFFVTQPSTPGVGWFNDVPFGLDDLKVPFETPSNKPKCCNKRANGSSAHVSHTNCVSNASLMADLAKDSPWQEAILDKIVTGLWVFFFKRWISVATGPPKCPKEIQ